MRPAKLFGGDRPALWTISSGHSFIQALAVGLADAFNLADRPDALADALIYLPNRRSQRSLAEALYQAAGQKPILLPDIRALGDLETDEAPSGAEEALAGLGPALPAAKRLAVLARMVTQFYTAQGLPLPPRAALSAAAQLGQILDSAALSGEVDWGKLPELVQERDLAQHWQNSLDFLKIITEAWPEWLAENNAEDPFTRRKLVAASIAKAWEETPPKGAVIIAGSSGATEATQILMRAALRLDQGGVVFPGLDRQAPATLWEAILADKAPGKAGEPEHPQFSLFTCLHNLGLDLEAVKLWPGLSRGPEEQARRRLIHESLAPASQTADWLIRLQDMAAPQSQDEFTRSALAGLSLIEAEDEAEEALLAALALRQTLETPGKTGALITPDAGLARQVSALLKRWNIDLAPSAGLPLARSQQGSLALLAAQWALDPGDPVHLMAVLKHGLIKEAPETLSALEIDILRGPRHWTDLDDLLAFIQSRPAQTRTIREKKSPEKNGANDRQDALIALVKRLNSALQTAPALTGCSEPIDTAIAVDELYALLSALTGQKSDLWRGPAGEALSNCLEDLREIVQVLSPLSRTDFIDIFEYLAAQHTLREEAGAHPRLHIWGPLEARLHQADTMVLAGLNETIWPQPPNLDGFLPRHFRGELGLLALEARLGLAAHDFAQFANAPNVLMLYSTRREDAPALPSRWVLRLKTLAEGALGPEGAKNAFTASEPAHTHLKSWARALRRDALTFDTQLAKPVPRPPVEARPKRLSVTRIDGLQRDPYAIYADQILELKKLRPLNAELDARQRGTAIHAALEDFHACSDHAQTADWLSARFAHHLARAGDHVHSLIGQKAHHENMAAAYLAWWQARRGDITQAWSEKYGRIDISIEGRPFTLSGIADRLELMRDGAMTIIDFKTGAPATRKAVEAGFNPQLPLLGLMAEKGGFDLPVSAHIGAFGYLAVKAKFEEKIIAGQVEEANTLILQAEDTLIRLLKGFQDPETPYLSIPRVLLQTKYKGDYDLLARRAEWGGDINSGETE